MMVANGVFTCKNCVNCTEAIFIFPNMLSVIGESAVRFHVLGTQISQSSVEHYICYRLVCFVLIV